jgi:predicted MFS family arabinose efflux permease
MNLHKESDRLWTRSFISLTISAFLLFLNLQMLLSSLSSYVKNDLAASDLEVSLVTSVFAVSAILARFLTAAMLRKFSPNVLLFAGLIIAAIMTELNDWVGSVGGLLLVRAGYGFGFGIGSTILPTLVSRIIPPSRMGEGIGYFGLSSSLAMSIGPMIGLNLLQKFGFGTLTLSGTMAVLVVIPLLLLTRALPRSNNLKLTEMKTTPGAGDSTPKRRAPFNRKLLFPAFLNTLFSITYSGLLSFIALFGEFIHLEQVGLFFLFNAATVVIIRPISGRIFDAKGPGAVLIPAALLVVASMVVLSFTQSLPMLIVSALLYGLGFGATQPTLQAWMLRSSTPEQYGMANSMFFNTTDFGVAIGAIILGAIASATNYAVMYRYSAGVMGLFLIFYVVSHLLGNKRLSTKNDPADRAEVKVSSTS